MTNKKISKKICDWHLDETARVAILNFPNLEPGFKKCAGLGSENASSIKTERLNNREFYSLQWNLATCKQGLIIIPTIQQHLNPT